MGERLRRLLHGQTCPVCDRRRRVRWYSNTGCCTRSCVEMGLFRVQAGWSPSGRRMPRLWAELDESQYAGRTDQEGGP